MRHPDDVVDPLVIRRVQQGIEALLHDLKRLVVGQDALAYEGLKHDGLGSTGHLGAPDDVGSSARRRSWSDKRHGKPFAVLHRWGAGFLYFKFEQADRIKANISLFVFLSSTTAASLADGLKLLFGRSRPHLFIEKSIYTFHPLSNSIDFSSFPSDHAAVAGAMATALSMLMPEYCPTFLLLAVLVASAVSLPARTTRATSSRECSWAS
jgi:hypothetical protein